MAVVRVGDTSAGVVYPRPEVANVFVGVLDGKQRDMQKSPKRSHCNDRLRLENELNLWL